MSYAGPEVRKAYLATWRSNHREQAKLTTRAWRAANLERARTNEKKTQEQKNARRRARVRAALVEKVLRETIGDRDGWKCQICNDPIDRTLHFPDPQSFSVDHVIPIARGGLHAYDNCQATHLMCNLRKGLS